MEKAEIPTSKAVSSDKPKKNLSEEYAAKIIALGYSDQNNTLVDMGFRDPKKNLKLLTTYNGDLVAVLDKILQKYEKKEKNLTPEEDKKLKNKKQAIPAINKQLEEDEKLKKEKEAKDALIQEQQKEQDDIKKTIEVEAKAIHEKNKVIEEKKSTIKEPMEEEITTIKKSEPEYKKYKKEKGYKQSRQEKDEKYLKVITTLGLEKQYDYLVKQGYTHPKKVLCALIENDGDTEKAMPTLRKHEKFTDEFKKAYSRSKLSPEEKQKLIIEELTKLTFISQNEQLINSGFTEVKRNLKALKKFDGDIDKALQYLKEKEEKHQSRKGSKEGKEGKHRRHKKEEKIEEEKVVIPKKSYESFPENIKTIYLDGNNMLFVDENIRKLVLARKKKDAEKIIASLATKFASTLQKINTVLVFDNTSQVYKETIVGKDGNVFKFDVCSASPAYKTSDDALVDWAGEIPDLKNTLFVTSDKGLRLRLHEKGGEEVMSTGNWFRVLKDVIGNDIYDSIVQTPKK